MTFRKSCFFKALFACICLVGWVDVSIAIYCDQYQPAEAGYWCHNTQVYPCREGCYCLGGRSTATTQNVQNKCSHHEDPELEAFGVYLCPDNFPKSDAGAATISRCYTVSCPGVEKGYRGPYSCDAGSYLPAKGMTCSLCEAGYYCPGGSFQFSCYNNQERGQCTGNRYSVAGSSSCQVCEVAGYAVTKNADGFNTGCARCPAGTIPKSDHSECEECPAGSYSRAGDTSCLICDRDGYAITQNDNGLNTSCDSCSDGWVANSDHSACEECPAGYMCTSGRAIKCVGNQYSSVTRSTVCSSCTGPGMGVVVTTENSNGEELHVGCDICDSGKYADQGVCKTCPAGHHCSEGIDLGLCGSGSCAASSGSNACVTSGADTCKTCPEDWFSNDDRTGCLSCADVIMPPFNEDLYQQATVRGLGGESMCGIKLAGSTKCQVGQDGSNVIWYIVNGVWRLGANTVVADRHSYVKSPTPDSPVGADADWCAECPAGTYNLSGGRGAGACKKCSAGYCIYSNDCLPCKPGYYCPGTDGAANNCSTHDGDYGIESEGYKCEKGTFSGAGQASCKSCGEGYTTSYEGTAYNQNGETCIKIPVRLKKNITDAEPVVLPANVLKEKGRVNRSVIRKNN